MGINDGNCHVAQCDMSHFTPAELAHGLNEVFVGVALCIFMRGRDWHCRIVASPIDQRLKSMYKTDRVCRVGRFLRKLNDSPSKPPALEEPWVLTSPVCYLIAANCPDLDPASFPETYDRSRM
jgi:hypothetical protein